MLQSLAAHLSVKKKKKSKQENIITKNWIVTALSFPKFITTNIFIVRINRLFMHI